MNTRLQEISDKIILYLLKQGQRSEKADVTSDCLYRQDETPECPVRCAGGVMIPDDIYLPQMEGAGFEDLIYGARHGVYEKETKEWADTFSEEEVVLITRFQSVHDYWEPSRWHQKFQEITKGWDLTFPNTELED